MHPPLSTGHVFKAWDVLRTEISHGIRAHSAVLDGEILCLDDGRPNFHKLLFRREWPFFFAVRGIVDRRRGPGGGSSPHAQTAAPRDHAEDRLAAAICRSRARARTGSVPGSVQARPRRGPREVRLGSVFRRCGAHIVDQNQEPYVFADGRTTRVVRASPPSRRSAASPAGSATDTGTRLNRIQVSENTPTPWPQQVDRPHLRILCRGDWQPVSARDRITMRLARICRRTGCPRAWRSVLPVGVGRWRGGCRMPISDASRMGPRRWNSQKPGTDASLTRRPGLS